jgi:hypothetical protein
LNCEWPAMLFGLSFGEARRSCAVRDYFAPSSNVEV